jgi:hypothetical protein
LIDLGVVAIVPIEAHQGKRCRLIGGGSIAMVESVHFGPLVLFDCALPPETERTQSVQSLDGRFADRFSPTVFC